MVVTMGTVFLDADVKVEEHLGYRVMVMGMIMGPELRRTATALEVCVRDALDGLPGGRPDADSLGYVWDEYGDAAQALLTVRELAQ